MMGTTVQVYIDSVNCGKCGVYFGLEQSFHEKAQRDGSWFYCPNGHHIHYMDSEVNRLKRERVELERKLAAANGNANYLRQRARTLERSRAAVKGQLTKERQRASNGVCPAGCQRHFANLHQHMASKHPEYPFEAVKGDSELAYPCTYKGCDKSFDTKRGRAIHYGHKHK